MLTIDVSATSEPKYHTVLQKADGMLLEAHMDSKTRPGDILWEKY